MGGALDGIKVLDLTQQLVGPGATWLLAEMGAEVLHVELPPAEEGPVTPTTADQVGRSRVALSYFRSKKSISLDLTKPEGREALHRLAAEVDVLYHNYRPGVPEQLGVDYATISAINPRIVYCGVNAFGAKGPELHRVGFDIIAQAGGGAMAPSYADPGLPVASQTPIGDVTGFCLGALGVVSALLHRERTGEGQAVGTSLLHSVLLQNILQLTAVKATDGERYQATAQGVREMAKNGAPFSAVWEAVNADVRGIAYQPGMGGGIGFDVYYRTHRTSDGFIAIGCLNPRQQRRLNTALELGDPRFEGAAPVDLNDPEVLSQIGKVRARAETIFAGRTTDEWISFLDEQKIACGRVQTVVDLLTDGAHALENEMIIEYDDPWVGTVRSIGHPITFSKTPMRVTKPASPLGQETDEILALAGYDASAIAALRERRVAF